MLELTPLDSLREVYPDTASAALEAMVIQNYFKLGIDYKEVDVPRWYFHYELQSNQRGFLTYLDISKLEDGLHHLQVSTFSDSTLRNSIIRYSILSGSYIGSIVWAKTSQKKKKVALIFSLSHLV